MSKRHELETFEQRELEAAMSDISEISYCAGWLIDNEVFVWKLIHGGGDYGMVTWRGDEQELERVRRASAAADAWIVWAEDHSGPIAVPLAEWSAAHPIDGGTA